MVESNHLRLLYKVFHNRGRSWTEFGEFLHFLFHDPDSGYRLSGFGSETCRHGAGQPHDLRADWPRVQACRVSGTWDKGKHRKIVSSDLRDLARKWLSGHYSNATLSQEESNAEETEMSEQEVAHPEEIFTIEDVESDMAVGMSESFRSAVSTPPLNTEGERVRTGLRVHHLTFLYRQWCEAAPAARALAVKEAATSLESETGLQILHVCGCGLCKVKGDGCVEPSHLVAGSAAINKLHTSYHVTLSQVSESNYRKMRQIINEDCDGGEEIL